MPISLESMRQAPKRREMLDWVLGVLSDAGFQLTDWNSGSIQRTFLESASAIGADVASLVTEVANFCYNRYATGGALREYSRSSYGNTPGLAVKTKGPATLASTAASAYTLQVGQLIASTDNDVDFTNVTGGVLPANGTLVLQWEALLGGSGGNVPNNAIKRLKTPLAGVTVSNPAGLSGIWYTTSGADAEPTGKMRDRNTSRWGTLNQVAMPSDGYRFLALSVPAVTRVYIDDQNPQGPGSLDAYLATANGPATSTEINAVQALFDAKKPPGSKPRALAPTPFPQAVAGTVHIRAALNTPAKRQQVLDAIDAFLLSVPIGGVILPPATTGVIPFSELITAVSQIAGVTGFSPTTPTQSVPLTPQQIVTVGAKTLTFLGS